MALISTRPVTIFREGDHITAVSITPTEKDLNAAVKKTFDDHGGLKKMLAGRTRVIIKVNAVNFHPATYTDPAVLKAVITNIQDCGVKDIRVMENCTQGSFTRLVFEATGIGKVCRQTGARAVYLDEGRITEMQLPGQDGKNGKAGFNPVLKEIIPPPENRDVFFINLPKLKTHSMTVVTLGIKNLLGLMDQGDRMHDHNYNLHARLAALGVLFQPDFTLVEGLKAVYHGHYPPKTLLAESTVPMNILIGGPNMLSVDVVGARILGYEADEVEHIRLYREHRPEGGRLEEIKIYGDISKYTQKYPYTLIPRFPDDVKVYEGTERCCPEGCYSNTLALLQIMHLDHGGKGGFSIVMGKGFSTETLSRIRPPVLLAGKCAIEETKDYLRMKYGTKSIKETPACNDLASTIKALTRLMKVSTMQMAPVNPVKSLILLTIAKIKGTRARVTI